MRLPMYIGISADVDPKDILEDANATVEPSAHWPGGKLLTRGKYVALASKLGTKTVGGTAYDVWAVLVISDAEPEEVSHQKRVYRWFKNHPDIVGPYILHNAPTPLLNLLQEISGDTARTVWCIAGDEPSTMDSLTYTEGADPNGAEDDITGAEDDITTV